MSSILNIDENSNLLTKVSFSQDFRDVHSKCHLVFTLPDDYSFYQGSSFTCWGMEWEAVSCKKTILGEDSYSYSVLGFPRAICSVVTSKHLSISSLAHHHNLGFDYNESVDLRFEFAMRNILLGPLLFKYRYASLERNLLDLGKAYFIFYDGRGLVSYPYSHSSSLPTREFDLDITSFLGGSLCSISDQMFVSYNKDHFPSRCRYKNFISSIIGGKFDFKGRIPGLIGSRYLLVGQDEDRYSQYNNLILVRQSYDSSKEPLPWHLTFGQLEV